jgi:hypothetical protein
MAILNGTKSEHSIFPEKDGTLHLPKVIVSVKTVIQRNDPQ